MLNVLNKGFSRLHNLKRLRLEKGQEDCATCAILDTICLLQSLKQLELINFDIGKYFHRHLARCENVETLLLVPTYYEVEFEDTIVPSDIIMIEDPVTTEILTGRLQFLETVVDSELVELLPNTRFSIL
ncbi:hypothetical protein J6590_089546 [Homalodisca vitripennis]|nr:hypothetical protein J6590_089546 [Homalodisca vitripennis]